MYSTKQALMTAKGFSLTRDEGISKRRRNINTYLYEKMMAVMKRS
jgi:hypothetical protein